MLKRNQKEFNKLISEMLENDHYMALKEFSHHDEEDIVSYNIQVARMSYRIAKLTGADVVSTTRGAMLHDFFHYDWKEYKQGVFDFRHTRNHPIISYENAKEHFGVNVIEADIILKHMFPLTIAPPKYVESYIVTLSDKVVATRNFLTAFKLKKLIPKLIG